MGTARVQGQRDVALVGLPFRGIAVNDATNNAATVTVYASDSGIMFINEFAGSTAYTLPAVADGKGKWFLFYGGVSQDIVITGVTSVLVGGNASAGLVGATITGGGAIGIWCAVIGDGDKWYAIPGTGTWTYST